MDCRSTNREATGLKQDVWLPGMGCRSTGSQTGLPGCRVASEVTGMEIHQYRRNQLEHYKNIQITNTVNSA